MGLQDGGRRIRSGRRAAGCSAFPGVSSYAPPTATGLAPFDHETLMPFGEPVDISPYIGPIFSLTARPFEYAGLIQRCKRLGWKVEEEENGDDFGYCWFRLARSLRFGVDAGIGRGGPLALAYLYHYDEGGEMGLKPNPYYRTGREDYARAFEKAQSAAEIVLGQPAERGQYQYDSSPECRYGYATWAGDAAALVIKQDDIDPQFGMDVDLWIASRTSERPLPRPPFRL
jgi:hypothetical protein